MNGISVVHLISLLSDYMEYINPLVDLQPKDNIFTTEVVYLFAVRF